MTVIGEEAITLSAADKWQLLQTWQRFLLSSFKNLCFTGRLYRFLIHHCGFAVAHYTQEQFWAYYMNSTISRFRTFLTQSDGDRRSVEAGNHLWLGGPAADLKKHRHHRRSRGGPGPTPTHSGDYSPSTRTNANGHA